MPALEEALGVARVGAADVGAQRAAQALRVVGVGEVVDPRGVVDDVAGRARRGRARAASRRSSARRSWPRACPGRPGSRAPLLLHVGAEGRDVGLRACGRPRTSRCGRNGAAGASGSPPSSSMWPCRNSPGADVAPAAGAVGLAVAGPRLHAAAGDRRLRDPVEEAEVVLAAGQRLGARLVDHRRRAVRLAELAQHLAALVEVLVVDRVDRDEHVRLAGAQAGLPVLGRARAAVAEALGARGHALAELGRERGEDLVGHAERLQAGVGEARRAVAVGGGPSCHGSAVATSVSVRAHQRARPVDVVDVQEDVRGASG